MLPCVTVRVSVLSVLRVFSVFSVCVLSECVSVCA